MDRRPKLLDRCGFYKLLHRRYNHEQEHCLRLCGSFERLNISLVFFCADAAIVLQIIQGLKTYCGNLGQVARDRRQILSEERLCKQGLKPGIVVPPKHERFPRSLPSFRGRFS